MIGLLPIGRVIAYTSVAYAVLIALAAAISWRFCGQSQTAWGIIGLAFSGATALQLALMWSFYSGWRLLWAVFPRLNRWLWPDIGGEWKIKIDWRGPQGKFGTIVDADATIRQDFLRVSMEVKSPGSNSRTLIAEPKKDPASGRPLLYYVYLVDPIDVGPKPGLPYYGVAILQFSDIGVGQLSGNYWTSQQTRGHFQLSRHTLE